MLHAEPITPVDPDVFLQELLQEQHEITAIEKYSQHHEQAEHPSQQKYYKDLIPLTEPKPGQQLAFEVDMDACTGCKACVTACHSLNGLDEDETWRSVGLLTGGSREDPMQQHVTSACHHCLEPACMEGCPVKAYEKNEVTGIVKHLDDQCIGCQYCVLKCPYDVPKYNKAKGIVRKCDMCSDRLKDGEAPACVQACPNSAIRIVVVDTDQIMDDSEESTIIPGVISSDYTKPTSSYKSAAPLPKNALPVNYYAVKPEHAHTPLIIMLILTQLSVGAFCVDMGLSAFMSDQVVVSGLQPFHSAVALALGLLALNASVFHLGRPLYAFRAFIGLRTSWLSREILVFALFAGLATTYAGLFWLEPLAAKLSITLPAVVLSDSMRNSIGMAVAVSGLLGVFCSVMIYGDCRRELWRETNTGIKFFMTTLILGLATVLMTSTLASLFVDQLNTRIILESYGRQLCLLLAIVGAVKLLWDISIFRHLRSSTNTLLKRSALLMIRDLKRASIIRFAAAAIGGVLFPLLMISILESGDITSHLGSLSALTIGIFLLAGLGELAERYLFFTAVVSKKMPGGI